MYFWVWVMAMMIMMRQWKRGHDTYPYMTSTKVTCTAIDEIGTDKEELKKKIT